MMKLLLTLLIIFSSYKTFECLPTGVVVSTTQYPKHPVVNALAVTTPGNITSGNTTPAVFISTLPATTPQPTVRLLNPVGEEMLRTFENETDLFEIVASDGKLKVPKSLMKACSSKLVQPLENGTTNSVTLLKQYSYNLTLKAVEFCKYGSISSDRYEEYLYDFGFFYKIPALRTYLANREAKMFADDIAAARMRKDRLDAAAAEARGDSKQNLYLLEALLMQVLLLFVLV